MTAQAHRLPTARETRAEWNEDKALRYARGERGVWACTVGAMAFYPDKVEAACEAVESMLGVRPNPERLAYRVGLAPALSPMAHACREVGHMLALALCPERRGFRPTPYLIGL